MWEVTVTLFGSRAKEGALIAVALGVLLTGCGSADDVPPVASSVVESSTPSAAPVTTTVTTTTTTVVLGPEIFDGEFYAAYNAGDFERYFSFFVEGGQWLWMTVPSTEADDFAAWFTASGASATDVICRRDKPTRARCSIKLTTDLYGPAGLTLSVTEEFSFDDSGMITSFDNFGDFDSWYDFDDALTEWVAVADPEAATQLQFFDDEDMDIEYLQAQLALLSDFLDWSDEYPKNVVRPVPDPILSGSVRGIDLFNADAKQEELVEWALGRFDSAGLTPSHLTAATFPPTDACNEGFSGVTFHTDSGAKIDLCVESDDLAGSDGLPLDARRTILHELAHVWIAEFVGEESRQAFVDLRGLDVWTGTEVWQENGSEQAAEIMTWALMDTLIQPRIPNRGCNPLTTAYKILTGTMPTTRTC